MSRERIVTQAHHVEEHPKALALYCSDGRFTEAIEEVLRGFGHFRVDTLTLPGGPGLFNRRSARLSESEVVDRAAAFLIRSHKIEQAVLVAHKDCGYYRERHSHESTDRIAQLQVEALRTAERHLKQVFPLLDVMLLYASPENGRVVFERL